MKVCIGFKTMLLLNIMAVFFLSGCRNYIVPDPGAVAVADARIALPADGVRSAAWRGKDMIIEYSIFPDGTGLVISGTTTIDDSITMSFPAALNLQVKISFLDDQGKVLGTADITPRYSAGYEADRPLTFKSAVVPPAGASFFAFSYWGSFVGIPRSRTETWDINYFPFQ